VLSHVCCNPKSLRAAWAFRYASHVWRSRRGAGHYYTRGQLPCGTQYRRTAWTDRATQRKCWYVRAPDQPAQQAAAPPRKSTPKSMESTSAPSGPLPAAKAAPTPVNSADAGRLRPQIEVPASAPPTSAAPNDTAPSIQLAAMAASAGAEPSEPTPNVAPASSATMQDTAPIHELGRHHDQSTAPPHLTLLGQALRGLPVPTAPN
jgi:hypothetical protein